MQIWEEGERERRWEAILQYLKCEKAHKHTQTNDWIKISTKIKFIYVIHVSVCVCAHSPLKSHTYTWREDDHHLRALPPRLHACIYDEEKCLKIYDDETSVCIICVYLYWEEKERRERESISILILCVSGKQARFKYWNGLLPSFSFSHSVSSFFFFCQITHTQQK